MRELAFQSCVNLIANAIGICDFKTFKANKLKKGLEYWRWNYQPNKNQNSTEFIHELIYRLCYENEALIVSVNNGGKSEMYIADSFSVSEFNPLLETQYKDIAVGNKTFKRPASEVLHFKLNHKNISTALEGIYSTYGKLVNIAQKNYSWASGKHLKVHVDQLKSQQEGFEEIITDIINKQVKPFLNGENGVLPEFDGYNYENFGGSHDSNKNTRDIKELINDIYSFTANAFGIPPVLLLGEVADTQDSFTRFLTNAIDPICAQIQEEVTAKKYGFDAWSKGDYFEIDTSKIIHFDMFANAANIEKLIGSAVYSVNEVRVATGESRINEAWADKHLLTLNIQPVETVASNIDE